MNLALQFRPFTFFHRKRGEAYLRLDLKLKTIEQMHQTRNNHGMAKNRHKNQQNNQFKNANHQELINVNSRSRLRAHVPGYPCSILQCRIYIPSSHECKWQPWRINRFWPNKSRRERMFIRCKITQNLNTMLFVKFCCVWQKPGIPSVSNINSTPRNSRNVENLRKLISYDSTQLIRHIS